jgi:hypothetical protein
VATFLPVGSYLVEFRHAGFEPASVRNVTLHVNDRLELDVRLAPGADAGGGTAGSARPLQAGPAMQSLVSATQIAELPINNRHFAQLATLVPGVVSDLDDEAGVGLDSRMSLSLHGSRRSSLNWLLDGASNVDVGSNITLLSTPSLESIDEFKVLGSSTTAEWPRSGGGVVNVVTRSGTNRLRLAAYEFLRNDVLNANSYFRNQSDDPALRDSPPRLRYHNYGFSLGGPLKRDTLFLFFSQEWRHISRAPASTTARVPDPLWLSDPANANYVPPAERDPQAVRLLEAWPAPNLPGTNSFVARQPEVIDTRQSVARLDYTVSPRLRLMARYTHDRTRSEQAGGLFFGTPVPNVATTRTQIPGQVFVAQLTAELGAGTLNELAYHLTGNRIGTETPERTRNRKSDFGLGISELFPENRGDRIPSVSVSDLSLIGAAQLFDIEYRAHTLTNNLSLQRGLHSFKLGALVAFEQKNENAASETQGRFAFGAGGGFTAFQNFLRGNRDGRCGSACSYDEAERDVAVRFRFRRYEVYAQDSWRLRPDLTLDLGLRYALHPGVVDQGDVLATFSPRRFDPARAPELAAGGTLLVRGTGDPLNGIILAGVDSPYGRRVHATDKNNLSPRAGLSFDPWRDGRTLLRGGFGVYFDQPLVGVFETSAFSSPPFNNTGSVLNPRLADPAAGVQPATRGVPFLSATSEDFVAPRTVHWNLGAERQLYRGGVLELGYVGSRGDSLIRPVDVNQPQPRDVVRLDSLNRARPFLGWGSIRLHETTARSRYHALVAGFRHDAGRAGLLQLAYTLSRHRTDASSDRDGVDLPQDPLDLDAELAVARSDRTHVFRASYVWELPFFRGRSGLLRQLLGGWQLAGITRLESGPPLPRIVVGTNGGRRGQRANQVADPLSRLPSDRHWFNPAAFAPPPEGEYGQTPRAPLRLPGRQQWDLTLAKNFHPGARSRLQLRADFINAFNHTQFTSVDALCTGATACDVPGSSFGQLTGVRPPREIQLGLRFYWN